MADPEFVSRSERHLSPDLAKTSKKPEGRVVIPLLISKKWLCDHYGISHNPRVMYRHILTDEVLKQLGLSPAQVRNQGFKMFTAVQSVQLTEILSL